MIYKIVVRDVAGKEIPGALLTFTGSTGVTVGEVRTSNGWFSIDDNLHPELWDDGVLLAVSAPGYKPDSGWAMSDFDATVNNRITLVKGMSTALLVGVGAGAALLLSYAMGKRKKKVVRGFFDGIDTRVKLGLLVGGGFALYYLLSKDNHNKNLPITAKQELDQLTAQGNGPKMSATQADALSNTLTAAFGGCGTDEGTVYSVFSSLKNKADLLLLIYVYDVRSYQGCFEGMIWEENVSANLAQALSNELSSGELSNVNSILAGNGIDFSF